MSIPWVAGMDVFDLMAAVMAVGALGIVVVGTVTSNLCKMLILKAIYQKNQGISLKTFVKITLTEILIMTASLAVGFFSVASSIAGPDIQGLILLGTLALATVLHCAASIIPHIRFLEGAADRPNCSGDTSRDVIRAALMALLTPLFVSLLTVRALLSLSG